MTTETMAQALSGVAKALGHKGDAQKAAKGGKARKGLGREKARRKSRNEPMGETELLVKYPHVVPGTYRRGHGTTKMVCRAKLACGHEDSLFTSDLFQVKRCGRKECAKKAL